MDFVAIDVETANSDLSSICQVGIACFEQAVLVFTKETLVNPVDHFDPINISIHGIDEGKVSDSPTWPEVYPELHALITGAIVVSHTAFDRVSVVRACEKGQLPVADCRWLDSARVARRAWTFCATRGYGLASLANHLGIQYKPHDALEDARCAGEILLRAVAESGITAEEWLHRVEKPIHASRSRRECNPDGPLHGEVSVFTGALSLTRADATDMALAAGCDVDDTVTRRTTLLVVGNQDARKLCGHEKRSKHRKAEVLTAAGQNIRIITEEDFRRLIGVDAVVAYPRS